MATTARELSPGARPRDDSTGRGDDAPRRAARHGGGVAAPLLVAAALATAWLVADVPTPDLAAQAFRVDLFEREGFTLWNAHWYGGHHTVGYSLLSPPLAALLGVRLLGALAAVASAVLFHHLARGHFGDRARWGSLAFAAGTAADLFIGRLTYALGVAVALGALLALQRGRTPLAVALAAGTTVASPVAGLFLAMAGATYALSARGRRARGAAVALGAFLPAAALALAFPDGGSQPWGTTSFVIVLAICAAVLGLLPREQRTLRLGTAVYAAASIVAFALATPMGSNATRIAATFAVPLVLLAAPRRRAALAAAVLVPLAAFQWWAPVRETAKGVGDPSARAAYHAPLVAFLDARADTRGPARVEIPFTRMHWEAVHVARRHPLARGWLTQLDVAHHAILRGDAALDAARYRAWLHENGVRYVALPDVALDPSAEHEARVIRSRPAYLRPVWAGDHWQVFAVEGSPGLAAGEGGGAPEVTAYDTEGFTVRFGAAATATVKARFTPYWDVVAGSACVAPGPDGWTQVRATGTGGEQTVRVAVRFDLSRLVERGQRCGGGG